METKKKLKPMNKEYVEKVRLAKRGKKIDKIYDKYMQVITLLYNNDMNDNLPIISEKKMKEAPNEVFAMLYRYYSSNVWGYNPTFMGKRDLLIYKM